MLSCKMFLSRKPPWQLQSSLRPLRRGCKLWVSHFGLSAQRKEEIETNVNKREPDGGRSAGWSSHALICRLRPAGAPHHFITLTLF